MKKALRFIVVAVILWSECCLAQSQPVLYISSPSTGTTVSPGQMITVSVVADPSISEIAVVGETPLGFFNKTGPQDFALSVPADISIGRYQVSAIGFRRNVQDVYSAPVTFYVDSPQIPATLQTQPRAVRFRLVGDTMPLRVIGTFSDGSIADVSLSRRTAYSSTDLNVATVDDQGIVRCTGAGSAYIQVSNSGAICLVPVTVPEGPSDTVPPVTIASASPSPNTSGWNSSDVTVQFTSTDNAEGSGVKSITIQTSGAQSGQATVAGSTATVKIVAEGTTTISYFGTDNAGNVEQLKTMVVKLDKRPPAVSCSVTPSSLWPANHKMSSISTTVNVSDATSGPAGFKLVSVTSNEPDNGLGDGDTVNDIQGWSIGTACKSGQLRAERSGSGTGRIYTLTYTGYDVAGNGATCITAVTVPHNK